MDLSWCNITGEIPNSITQATNLQVMFVFYSSSKIPLKIFIHTLFQFFSGLSYNSISGTIPELSELEHLQELNLASVSTQTQMCDYIF